MALFNVSVFAQLNLPESVRLAIVKMAVDQGRTAAALEAIVAKLNEPQEPPMDEAAIQAQIDALTARLNASSDKLEQQSNP